MCSNMGAGGGGSSDGLGIGKKGKGRTIDDARTATNPNYFDPDARAKGWRHNCQSCSVTQEALIRGYDVEAVSHAPGDAWYPDADGHEHKWFDAFDSPNQTFYTRDGYRWTGKETSTMHHTERQVQKEVESWGAGARGIISVRWKGRGTGSHILNIINGGSEGVYLSDGQDDRRYRLSDVLSYASSGTGVLVTRVDTLGFTPNVRYLTKGK